MRRFASLFFHLFQERIFVVNYRASPPKRSGGSTNNQYGRRVILLTILCILALAALVFCISVVGQARHTISLTLNGDDTIVLEYGQSFQDPGASAQCRSLSGKAQELTVESSGSVDTLQLGTYTLTYRAKNRFASITRKRTVTVVDTQPPVLTLTDSGLSTPIGQDYVEEGYSATDNVDGDITDQVTFYQEGDKMYYSVADSSGNEATAVRTILYRDPEAPDLVLTGSNQVTISAGSPFSDPGYTALDDQDGDITDRVTISGAVNYFAAGTYTLTYSVTDSDGYTTSVQRSVTVDGDYIPEDHLVYLTFDDGPGEYTQQLLDVLAKYNVKATFFVTNAYPEYRSMIAAEAAAGHTVGIHSATHKYDQVYSSVSAYFDDLNTMNSIIEEQTGSTTHFLRFPGGSSNLVSAKYTVGIMTQLVQQVTEQGYIYYDWNVLSGDAGDTEDTQTVISNVISGLKANSTEAVVLQHDVKGFSVAAVDSIVKWGLENGYCFLPITDDTTPVHHSVGN
jgi:peptidoglycan/xylan/chitin deacetylase (PgdA/CDA1 family)